MEKITKYQRASLRIAIALFAVSAALLSSVWLGRSAPVAHASCDDCTGAWYGGLTNYMNYAIGNGIWPQGNGNYCGIESAIAVANYDSLNKGQPQPFTDSSAQYTVQNNNDTLLGGESQWGYAQPTNQWGGYTNIAADFGTDPRSVAYMQWNYTINNTFYHDYLYRPDLEVGSQSYITWLAEHFGAQQEDATTKLAVALEAYSEPVSVPINGGLHIVVVSGLWSGNDPMTNFPAAIQGLVYRDPEGDLDPGSLARQEIDYSVWASGNYSNPFGVYSLWSLYYGDLNSRGDHLNSNDPEPNVGPYAPNSSYPYHWYNGWDWIRLDNNYSNGQWSPDWAYDSITGAQMTTP